MPLSEHEQRMLDEIESGLYADDPKFASSVRRSSSSSVLSPNLWKFVLLGIVGLALLIVGLALGPKPGGFPVLSLLGFVVMFGAGVGALMSGGSRRGAETAEGAGGAASGAGAAPAARGTRPRAGGRGKKSGESFSDRMEDRFRRRFEGGR